MRIDQPSGAGAVSSAVMAECTHVESLKPVHPHTTRGCEDCLKMGGRWVHLRLCLTCGNVGCCDSSPNRHATKHFHATQHPIIQSMEPGEDWGWCYVDEVEFEGDALPARG